MSRAPSDSGFSLIEALVALAVFAMAGVGLVQLQTHSLQTLSRVESRALADVVAQNRLVELAASAASPAPGASSEAITFAGRGWRVATDVASVGDGSMLRATIVVTESEGGAPGARAVGFIAAVRP